ncbi:MAG: hypothetical protein WAT51_00910, partial [Holophaga sp.]
MKLQPGMKGLCQSQDISKETRGAFALKPRGTVPFLVNARRKPQKRAETGFRGCPCLISKKEWKQTWAFSVFKVDCPRFLGVPWPAQKQQDVIRQRFMEATSALT